MIKQAEIELVIHDFERKTEITTEKQLHSLTA